METVQKTKEISQLKHTDHVDDVPVVLVVQVPQVQVVAETVEIPQLRIVEKIDETPEFDVSTGENPFAKVKGVIMELISRLEEALRSTLASSKQSCLTLWTARSRCFSQSLTPYQKGSWMWAQCVLVNGTFSPKSRPISSKSHVRLV